MNTQEIAEKLVNYCREGNFQACYEELYSPDAVSIEPKGAMMEYAEGMEQIQKKGEMWNESVEEMHSGYVSEPIVAGNHFSCVMANDITFKEYGRQKLEEICLYEVKDGKIVKEQFFYTMGS
jgi:hypothetical protein